MQTGSPLSLLFAALLAASASMAYADDERDDLPPCFDALVKAKVLDVFPSSIPTCEEDGAETGCIIISWPWFVDLQVQKSLVGKVPVGQLQTQMILHTGFHPRKNIRWWLRRNTLGSYNILRFDPSEKPRRCPSGIAPAKPLLQPGPNETIEQMRSDALREYRSQ